MSDEASLDCERCRDAHSSSQTALTSYTFRLTSSRADIRLLLQIVLRGKVVQANALPREKLLHLADLTAPRLAGGRDRERDDEPWAFESRDYLRSLVVGKEVSFSISYTVPTTNPPLEFGIVYVVNPDGTEVDVAAELVRAGWAKVRDSSKRDQANGSSEDDEAAITASRRAFLRDLEEEAKIMARGLWSTDRPPKRLIEYTMPSDPVAFLAEYKGKPLDGALISLYLLFPPH
jgi:staphylococcal nuclease domain-containing protein 1